MKRKAQVVIRMNAAVNTVTVDGREFDRTALNKDQNQTLRVMIREAHARGDLN